MSDAPLNNMADWDQSMAYHFRMSSLLVKCHDCRFTNSLNDWLNTLEAIYNELYPLMTADEQKSVEGQLDKLSKYITQDVDVSYSIKKAFNVLERELRKVFDDRGLMIKKKDTRLSVEIGES